MANENGWSLGLVLAMLVAASVILTWVTPLVYRDPVTLPEFQSFVFGCLAGWLLSDRRYRRHRQSQRVAEWWRRHRQAQRWVGYGVGVAALLLVMLQVYRDPRGFLDVALLVGGLLLVQRLRSTQTAGSAPAQP